MSWSQKMHDGVLTRSGVVLNEMKGAFADADELLINAMSRALFPASPYRFVSGGDPEAIPNLTYEAFTAAHKRFYHPANSYLLLDEKTVLVDTVDKSVSGLFFENVDHVLGGRKLDYLIVQHMEPDHAATIGDAAGRHHGNIDRIDNLRHQCHRRGLANMAA